MSRDIPTISSKVDGHPGVVLQDLSDIGDLRQKYLCVQGQIVGIGRRVHLSLQPRVLHLQLQPSLLRRYHILESLHLHGSLHHLDLDLVECLRIAAGIQKRTFVPNLLLVKVQFVQPQPFNLDGFEQNVARISGIKDVIDGLHDGRLLGHPGL